MKTKLAYALLLSVAVLACGFLLGARSASGAAPSAVIVVLRDQAALPTLPRASRAERLRHVIDALRGTADKAERPLLATLARRAAEGKAADIRPLWIIDAVALRATPDLVRELEARPDVLEVRPDRTLDAATSLATGTPEPNIAGVGAPALWELGDHGEGVVVANMDTGVDVTHADLAGSWRGGTDSWFDPNGEHPTTPTDTNGHGTWTMGVIVGGDAGGTSIGVAPAAKWIAAKIFDDHGVATTSGIHRAFQWLLDPDGNPTTADAPNVVEGSWTMSSGGCDLEFGRDIGSLRAAGILPVFAAGNGGPSGSTSFSPANNPGAFAVGSTDDSDALDPQTSRGPSACTGGTFPQLVAPGVDIRSTDLYGLYATESGTSMAAPHVAGALALLLSAFPGLSADRQESALEGGAVDLGAPGADDDTGYGRLDARGSYDWLLTVPDFSVATSPAGATVAAGGTVAFAVDVVAINGFSGDVSLTASGLDATQATWSLSPGVVGGGTGSSQLVVTVASSLAPGTYALTVTGTSGARTRSTTATLQISPPPDFALAASPSSASTIPGGSVSYSVNATPLNGFAAGIGLSLSGLTASQAASSFAPASISGSDSSTLTVTPAASLAPGTYPLTVIGTSGSTSHTATVNLVVVPPPDFALSATPSSASTLAGGGVSYTTSVTAKNGFSGAVALSLTGLTSSQATWAFAPASVTTSGSSKLTVTTTSSLAPGSYALKITGKSGSLTHTANVTLVVSAPPDFTLASSPTSASILAGSTASFTLTIGSKGGFAGSVSLTVTGVPGGATPTFTVNPVHAPGTSTLKVQTTGGTTRGTFSVKVTGTSGSLSHVVTLSLTVR